MEQQLKKLKSRLRLIRHMEENPCVPGSENLQISNLLDFRESSWIQGNFQFPSSWDSIPGGTTKVGKAIPQKGVAFSLCGAP